MRLVDADGLIKDGWVLVRYGRSNTCLSRKSIADVATAYDVDKVVAAIEDFYDEANRAGFTPALSDIIEVVKFGGEY